MEQAERFADPSLKGEIMEAVLEVGQQEELIGLLRQRFNEFAGRHPGIDWADVEKRLKDNPEKLAALSRMEATGGQVDVIGYDQESGRYLFVDCAKESPKGRRNLCYDGPARLGRKKFPPESSALEMATQMGVELIDQAEYALLQGTGRYDLKTSSWLKTPESIRRLSGAIFGDCRYDAVFTYHNGADSYYGSRGFRAKIWI